MFFTSESIIPSSSQCLSSIFLMLSALKTKNLQRIISVIIILSAIKMIQYSDEPLHPYFLPTQTTGWVLSRDDRELDKEEDVHASLYIYIFFYWSSLFLQSELLKFIPCCENQFTVNEYWFSCQFPH